MRDRSKCFPIQIAIQNGCIESARLLLATDTAPYLREEGRFPIPFVRTLQLSPENIHGNVIKAFSGSNSTGGDPQFFHDIADGFDFELEDGGICLAQNALSAEFNDVNSYDW